jgi:hypothetical protein
MLYWYLWYLFLGFCLVRFPTLIMAGFVAADLELQWSPGHTWPASIGAHLTRSGEFQTTMGTATGRDETDHRSQISDLHLAASNSSTLGCFFGWKYSWLIWVASFMWMWLLWVVTIVACLCGCSPLGCLQRSASFGGALFRRALGRKMLLPQWLWTCAGQQMPAACEASEWGP